MRIWFIPLKKGDDNEFSPLAKGRQRENGIFLRVP
jgi:hypothetical protein